MAPAPTPRRIGPRLLAVGAVVWATVVLGGLGGLAAYAGRGGDAGHEVPRWPDASALPHGSPATLVMVVHPMCPCSRASVAELARIAARSTHGSKMLVLFSTPDGSSATASDLWQSVGAIPGVTRVADPGGALAALFEARTSGHTVVYAADGAQLFRGGITAARAHEGDNAGEEAVVAFLNGASAPDHETSVFGCPLGDTPTSPAPVAPGAPR